jgi:hypothetical protein
MVRRRGRRNHRIAVSSRALGIAVALSAFFPSFARSQDNPTLETLEQLYRAAQAGYEAAFASLEALESQWNQAMEEFDAARSAGDQARANALFTVAMQRAGERRVQLQRVANMAERLRDARSALREALGLEMESLILQVDSAQDDAQRLALAIRLEDRRNWYLELRAEEDPETVLEPMRDINISPSDSPRDIRRKAATLDYRADQNEDRLAEIDRRLAELREDLRRDRLVSDFLSGVERYGDTRLPVGTPGRVTTPPPDPGGLPVGADSLAVESRPLTLEERIRDLEASRSEMVVRIQLIREKAQRFRDLIGGEGAWA